MALGFVSINIDSSGEAKQCIHPVQVALTDLRRLPELLTQTVHGWRRSPIGACLILCWVAAMRCAKATESFCPNIREKMTSAMTTD